MNIAARFNTAACSAVLIGSLTFCLADDRPLLALFTVPVVIAGWICGLSDKSSTPPWGERKPIALPRLLVNALVLGAIINAALRAGSARSVGQPIVSHLGEFLVYVQLLKLFDRRTVRDESQLLTLSVFVTIAAVLTSNNLLTGVGIIAYTPIAISATMLYQLRAGRARVDEGRPPSQAPTPSAAFQQHSGMSRQFTQTVWLCVLCAVFLGGVLFLLTPRGLGIGSLGHFGQPRSQVGFNDHIDLGRAGLLSESSTPVMDVSVQDSSGNNLGSPQKILYLRGFTRDAYDTQAFVWVRSRTAFTSLDFQPGSRTIFPVNRSENRPVYATRFQRITIRPSVSAEAYIFGEWRPVSIQSDDGAIGKLSYDQLDATIKRPKSAHTTFTYTIESDDTPIDQAPPPTPELGFQQGRIHDLAVSILRNSRIDYPLTPETRSRTVATAFSDYLQKNCTYTLDLWAPGDGRDPLEEFLFDKRTGHCQYFASALVALCQSVGIPARIVGGFVAVEYNSLTGSYLVRQSNAHAWAEVHSGRDNWIRVDPTPAADLERLHRADNGWFSAVRRWWETLEFGWNRSIVSFDSARQADTIGRRDPSDVSAWLSRWADKLRRGESQRDRSIKIPEWVMYIVPAIMVLAALAMVTGKLSKLRLFRDVSGGPRDPDPSLRTLLADAAFYTQALKALERSDPALAKPLDRPPLAHALALETHSPDVAQALRAISELYYAVRFGRKPLTPPQVAEAHAHLATLKSLLHSGRGKPATAP
ncbi:MAG: DUF3488 and DUF4129 domain-containing transglutaminase family protein [Phycisphaerales bacterium]